jgi:hypothetical protein
MLAPAREPARDTKKNAYFPLQEGSDSTAANGLMQSNKTLLETVRALNSSPRKSLPNASGM